MNTQHKTDTPAIMSEEEKRILRVFIPESDPLDYPTAVLHLSDGTDVMEYLLPPQDKEKLLAELYPFADAPNIDDEAFDLHEDRSFRISDYKVIREDNRNYLVSPYYANSGGMVIDWIFSEQQCLQ